jgi:transposase-like protein
MYFRKGILYIRDDFGVCPSCYSKSVSSDGYNDRLLYFYDEGAVNAKIKRYTCDNCGYNFITDLNEVVEPGCNYTRLFKEKILEFVSLFLGSVRKIAYKVKKDTGIDISHTTIENWILETENENKDIIKDYSGYYEFDVEHAKIKSTWNYRYTLFDSTHNISVADEVYPKEKKDLIKDFLDVNTHNQKKISITSDLDDKYKPIIEKLGFKHQYCLVHARKNINKTIKEYIKENNTEKDETKKIKDYKYKIFELFESTSYDKAKTDFNNILKDIKDYPEIIRQITLKQIMPNFETYFLFLKDPKVPKTTNQIENYFQKTLPQHIKKIMKIPKGVMTRIWQRKKIWDTRNLKTT